MVGLVVLFLLSPHPPRGRSSSEGRPVRAGPTPTLTESRTGVPRRPVPPHSSEVLCPPIYGTPTLTPTPDITPETSTQ